MNLRYPVVLASASPRRRELLRTLVPEFEIVISNVDEERDPHPDPVQQAEDLASAKALTISRIRPNALVIGADTVVALKQGDHWLQLAKPNDVVASMRMLRLLSGRSHIVVTGVCIRSPDGGAVFSEETTVAFRELSEAEIFEYAQDGEPLDKAGGYAIQGGAARFIESIGGSHSNVVGLPMEALSVALSRYVSA